MVAPGEGSGIAGSIRSTPPADRPVQAVERHAANGYNQTIHSGRVPVRECVMRPPPPRQATLFLAMSALALPTICVRADHPAVPHLARQSVPVPPRQKAPWTPPKCSIPDKHIKAAELLFEQ